MASRIARQVQVFGRVQGVWFRDSVRHEAEGRGVCGWARNRSDGTVQAFLEGEPDAVEAVVAWCRQGPPRAEVERIAVDEAEPRGLTGFDVR